MKAKRAPVSHSLTVSSACALALHNSLHLVYFNSLLFLSAIRVPSYDRTRSGRRAASSTGVIKTNDHQLMNYDTTPTAGIWGDSMYLNKLFSLHSDDDDHSFQSRAGNSEIGDDRKIAMPGNTKLAVAWC